MDEEDKEKGSDREERRWIEKNNKVQRAEHKKEEMKRIRKLVDNAYNTDPRIIKFREDEKNEKLAKKKAKQDAAKARRDEEERQKKEAEEKERLEKERIEAEEKAKKEALKKEKEALKKALKKERKNLRNIVQENGFYAENDDEKVTHMTELDRLCEVLTVDQLEALTAKLTKDGKPAYLEAIQSVNDKLEKEKMEMMAKSGKSSSEKGSGGKGEPWSNDELSLLIKAVNLFPAGKWTKPLLPFEFWSFHFLNSNSNCIQIFYLFYLGTNQRWEVVSSFINQHTKTPEIKRHAKETLAKAKELQHGDFSMSTLKDDANKRAYENLEKQKKRDVKVRKIWFQVMSSNLINI